MYRNPPILSIPPLNQPKQSQTMPQLVLVSPNLPCLGYRKKSQSIIPIMENSVDPCKFGTLQEAMIYIQGHCMFHHSKFTKNIVKQYLKNVEIYDPYLDAYVSGDEVNRKDFMKAFTSTKKRAK